MLILKQVELQVMQMGLLYPILFQGMCFSNLLFTSLAALQRDS